MCKLPHVLALLASVSVIGAGGVLAAPSAFANSSDSMQYFSRLNSERAARGLSQLHWQGDVAGVAQSWADHMANSGLLAHNPDLTHDISNWQVVGENVGVGPTIDDLDSAFMSSAEHRDNILEPRYQDVGVGSVRANGRIWITVDFRDPLVPERSVTPPAQAHPAVQPVVRPVAVADGFAARRPAPLSVRVLQADTPFAPGCMLRWVWL